MNDIASAMFYGAGVPIDAVGFEVEHKACDGITHMVRVKFELGGLDLGVDFNLETARRFVEEFDAALAEAKEADGRDPHPWGDE